MRSTIPGCLEEIPVTFSYCQQDSKLVGENDLFFALKGQKTDGHQFLEDVSKKKAVAAVVDKNYKGPDFGLVLFHSEDVLKSLQNLAKEELSKRKTKVIGITGSVGKTTTKEFLFSILEGHFKVEKSFKNNNSQITLPLTILNASEDADLLVLEMGLSKKGEMQKLTEIASPDIAIITKVALAHAENFENLEEIALAKAEIFSQEKTKIKIINREILPYLKRDDVIHFSLEDCMSDFYLSYTQEQIHIDEKGVRVVDMVKPFQEVHLLENLLAACTVARQIGLKWNDIVSKIPSLHTLPLRWEKVFIEGKLFINDCYNANLTSMQAALRALKQYPGRKVAVLGEMLELGKFSKSCHEEVAKAALENDIAELICYGKETLPIVEIFQKENKLVHFFTDKLEIVKYLKDHLQEKDVVLIKGSRGCGLEKIVETLSMK
jgi:UDP-N-acetylmuramoyl-tripeptide--D-alanyl-D-alanine ligase